MSNSLVTKPLIISSDLTSYRNDSTVKALGGGQGVRVQKLILAVGTGASSTAGSVTITAPSDSATLYPPLEVIGSEPAGTILCVDNPTAPNSSLTWRDFAVTGVTATGTVLYLWTEV